MPSSQNTRVAVLGAGSMGTTMAHLLARGGHETILFSPESAIVDSVNRDHRHPRLFSGRALDPRLRATTGLRASVERAELVLVAAGSQHVRPLARELAKVVTPEQIVLSNTKGIELGTLERMSAILAQETGVNVVGTIGGANVTPDMLADRLTVLVVATSSALASQRVAEILAVRPLRVRVSADLVGCELIGVLKNVAAIATGIAIGLDLSDNTRSYVVTRGVAEVLRIVEALGGQPTTFLGLAGLADLFLTTTSEHSLNRRLGIELGRGQSLPSILERLAEVPEGVHSVRACRALARREGIAAPLAEATAAILEGEQPASLLESVLATDREDVDLGPGTA